MRLEHEDLTYGIIGAAMEVHKTLGPGFLEGVYQEALELELSSRNLTFSAQPKISIDYKGRTLAHFYIPDLIVAELVVVELKAHSAPLAKADQMQILNSLSVCDLRVGLLINFGQASLEHKRFANSVRPSHDN
jgi:GxxExxY protein